MKRSFYCLTVASALILPSIITGCKKKDKNAQMGGLMSVEVNTPVVRNIILSNEYPGYIQALNTVSLVARVSGALDKVLYQPGDRVRKGDLLFVIEPTTYSDEVDQAVAQLNDGKANLVYTQATYERTKEAAKANAVSEIQVIQTQASYEQAIASVSNYEAQLQTAQTNLSYCYVKAPFTGRVSRNMFDVGNYLSGSSAPTLATIYQDDKVYAYFSVSDIQYLMMQTNKNHPGAMSELPELTIIPEAKNNVPSFKAKLDYFAPNIQMSTGTINMRGIIENTDGLLRDGMYVKVIMPYENKANAVMIPDQSIGTNQVGRYVYVVNDSSKVELRKVEIGQLIEDTLRVINSGLNPGDRYVTTALLKVRPGMKVKPVTHGQMPWEKKN